MMHGKKITRKNELKLAKKAISISEDCSDAYNLLAEEEAKTFEEMKELYQKGIEACKRAIGKKSFEEMKGHFWGYHETRPFMRSMCGLSNVLWSLDEKNKSVDIINEMLLLNPHDNQGMRYSLINKLLFLRRYNAAEKLLNDYDDDCTANWLYSKAFLYFNKPSKKLSSKRELIEALKFNPYVPFYLFGEREMPKVLPEYIGFGDENEAISYVDESLEVWGSNHGAIHWIAEQFRKIKNELENLIEKKEQEQKEQLKKLNN